MRPVVVGGAFWIGAQAMLNAADRMKSLGQPPDDPSAPASIFGSAAGLAQSIHTDERFRISVYPILCEEMPDVAMGLASCLCYLLEQYPEMRVYRCFARIDPADDSAEITASDYQFTVADWELEGLADNVILDGALLTMTNGFEMQLAMDTSLAAGGAENESLVYRFGSIAEAAGSLPAVASDVYGKLAGEVGAAAIIEYDSLGAQSPGLEGLLESIFAWNLDVYLYLWDVAWDETEIREQYLEVADLCEQSASEFPFWCLGMMAKQVMQPGISEAGDVVASLVRRAFPSHDPAAAGAAAAALGLSNLGQTRRALEFLEPYLQLDAAASVWCAMIEIHMATGQFAEAIDTCQLALEHSLRHSALYWRYAQLLMTADVHDWTVEDVLLIDPDEYDEEDQLTVEIANALKLYLTMKPDDQSALQLALTYMIDAEDDELWIYFERLLQVDQEGMFAGDVVDRLCELADHERAYAVLEDQLDSNAYAYVYLAQLALADVDAEYAAEMIDACRAALAEIDDDLELELQRLKLQVSLPAFEEKFAEIKVILSANRPVSEENVDLLEQAIKIAPRMIDLYVLLSKCYRSWKDNDSAFEVLQEAAQQAGSDPQIDLGIAQIHWARNERETAVSKLNAALQEFPGDVSLLVQLASYLIENDQFEDARQFIARAETIAPSHRAVWQVRRLVAAKMAQ
jgi:tetratricopeptide (TPR) repeat protein